MILNPLNFESLSEFYKRQVTDSFLPFWEKAVDQRHGGLFTCYNNEGTILTSKDKYTWSQGRAIWMWSRLAYLCQSDILPGEADKYLSYARHTADFIRQHAMMDRGHCVYLLSEKGQWKEGVPGAGYDSSIYADCFVVLGMAEYVRVTQDEEALSFTLQLLDTVLDRVKSGLFKSEPYPVPAGFTNYAIPMILLNITQEMAAALEVVGHSRASDIRRQSQRYMRMLVEDFVLEDNLVANMRPLDDGLGDTMLARHVCPGHVLEGLWFSLTEIRGLGGDNRQLIEKCVRLLRKAFTLGWDEPHGGLLRFCDRGGGPPQGRSLETRTDKLITETWDTKIWWPHSEGLYSLLLAYHLSGEDSLLADYHKLHEYTFSTFPNPDPIIGEWIQIRDRQGRPINKVVALPVKDPFHIMRSMMLIIELLEERA
jgi:N-acylglucosamine 2-epimerase